MSPASPYLVGGEARVGGQQQRGSAGDNRSCGRGPARAERLVVDESFRVIDISVAAGGAQAVDVRARSGDVGISNTIAGIGPIGDFDRVVERLGACDSVGDREWASES